MKTCKFSRALKIGFGCAASFTLLFSAMLLSAILKGSIDAQIAAAVISAPTSGFALRFVAPLLPIFGGYESVWRQAVIWIILFVCGFAQYFVIGYLISKFFKENTDP